MSNKLSPPQERCLEKLNNAIMINYVKFHPLTIKSLWNKELLQYINGKYAKITSKGIAYLEARGRRTVTKEEMEKK